ncbi:MAG: hypothetical protein JRH20_25050 [Deltaproteobacteria bacterium]|nr:hypothetical protein [Deltaproteobacteria bacterium]
MSEQNPNSVLFSLDELRRIEEERVASEEDAAQRAAEAQEQARVDAEKLASDQVEAARVAEVQRVQGEKDAREHSDREERIRIAEAERRARVDAEVVLQKERIVAEAAADAQVKAHKLRNTILGITAAAVVALGGLGYFLYIKSEETATKEAELAAQKASIVKMQKDHAEEQRKFQAEQDALEKEKAKLTNSLATAKTDAQRALLRKQLAARYTREAALGVARRKASARAKRRAKHIRLRKGDDPLGGLKL